MRLKWFGWLLVGLLWCWGGVTPVQAATDAQQSQYQVKLTPSASSVTSGSDGNLVSGGSGATGSTGSTDHHPSAPGDSAGSAASPPPQRPASKRPVPNQRGDSRNYRKDSGWVWPPCWASSCV